MILPKRVIIIGGTHGNEWTGIAIVNHFQDKLKQKFSELSLEFIFANPEAFKLGKRFKDEDLNRTCQFLDQKRTSSEHLRAIEIKTQIQLEPCVVIDLHTTTSNMGNTLIISNDRKENLSLAGLIQKDSPEIKILISPDPAAKYLVSQSPFGLMIEIGPIANNVFKAEIIEKTLELLELALTHISDFKPGPKEIEVFEEIEDVYYPQDEKGKLSAYIHSDIQDHDFIKKKHSFKAFKTFTGQEIEHKLREELYPIFINEAAYYPQNLAFTLCRKSIKKI